MSDSKLTLIVGGLNAEPAKPYKPRIRAANLVIFRSLDPEAPPEKWEAIKPDAVPEFLKTDESINNLISGNIAQAEAFDEYWYRAEQFTVQH
jgi:hypothetical protein